MAERYVLGIDVGTTSTKTLLVSESGQIIASHSMEYPLLAPGLGRSEQNAADWWHAVVGTVRAVCAPPGISQNIRGIALSTQGGTLVPVDERLTPLSNAIVWSDARCAGDQPLFDAALGEDYIYQISGWKLGRGLPAMQLRRMRQERPELFRRAAMFLTVPDYIAAKLTGQPAIDLSNAGINHLTDIRKGAYDSKVLDFLGVRPCQLARHVTSCQPIGTLTPRAALELGLREDVIVSGGAHDQYAVALGAGICESGDAVIGTGTAWVVTALRDAPDFTSGFAQSVSATPGKWGTMLSISTGGVCLDWFRKHVAGLENAPLDYQTINDLINKRAAPGANGLTFYPYFNGSSLPESDRSSKATLLGLDLSHDRCDVAQAIMEGVACQIVWALEALEARQPVKQLRIAGGATKSPAWMQMVADLAGRPVDVAKVADLACAGAAMMAGVGCGLFRDTADAAARIAAGARTVEPNPEGVRAYRALFEHYKRGARGLRALYAEEKGSHGTV